MNTLKFEDAALNILSNGGMQFTDMQSTFAALSAGTNQLVGNHQTAGLETPLLAG